MRLIITILLIFLLTNCVSLKTMRHRSPNSGKIISDTITYNNNHESDNDGVPDYIDLDPVIIAESKMVRYEEEMLFTNNPMVPKVISESIKIIEVPNNKVSTSTTSGGHIAYKIPNEMSVRSTYQVIVRISKSTVHIYENLNGDVKTSSIPISETMEVKVIDPSPSDNKMFEIIPDNTPIQLVENNEHVTQWTFNVTPIRSGTSKLKVVISTITNGFTKEVVYEDEVKVKIDITKSIPFFIATYWQWLLTTLIIPIIIWYNKFRKKDVTDERVN